MHGRQRHRDDGNAGLLDDGARRRRARREQHIHGPPRERFDQRNPAADIAAGRLRIDDDAAALDIAEVGDRLAEGDEGRGVNLRRRKTDKSHDRYALLLGERSL